MSMPAASPGQTPAKKGSRAKTIIGGAVPIVIVGAVIASMFVLPRLLGLKKGDCLDYYPSGMFETGIHPKRVECTDPAARSRIVAVLDDQAQECPDGTARLFQNDTVYCLVRD